MSSTATPTFRLIITTVSAKVSTFVPTNGIDGPASALADPAGAQHFQTLEAAQAFVDSMPKALGLKAQALSGSGWEAATVSAEAKLSKDGTNGGKNETGIKRVLRWVADLDCEYAAAPYTNSYPTLEAALAALAD